MTALQINQISKTLFLLVFILESCTFFNKEDKAIEIVKKSIVTGLNSSEFDGLNWLDFANSKANENSHLEFQWKSECENSNSCFVSFVDENGSGEFWEVNLDSEITIYINQSDYLSRMYGLTNVVPNSLIKNSDYIGYGFTLARKDDSNTISFLFRGDFVNDSEYNWIDVNPEMTLKLVYKDKTVIYDQIEIFEEDQISYRNPWGKDEKKQFFVVVGGVEKNLVKPSFINLKLILNSKDIHGDFTENIVFYEDLDVSEEWDSYTHYSQFDDTPKLISPLPLINSIKTNPWGYYYSESPVVTGDKRTLSFIQIVDEDDSYKAWVVFDNSKNQGIKPIILDQVILEEDIVKLSSSDPENSGTFFVGQFIDQDSLIDEYNRRIFYGKLKIDYETFMVQFIHSPGD